MEIDEDAVPVRPDVQAACEMLGYDVLQVANEGKMVAVVPAEQADAALAAMRAARYGENAAIIGRVLPIAEDGLVPPCACAPAGARRVSSTCSWESSCRGFASRHGAQPPQCNSRLLQIFRFQARPTRKASIMRCALQLKRQEHPWQQRFPM